MPAYFSDRQRAPIPRTNETIESAVWGGIYAIVSARLADGSFGHTFPENCKDALEKLWDAFERIKTLEPGQDKKAQVTALLNKAAKGQYRSMLEAEATELTRIGNSFRIRHSETTQESLTRSAQADYLFHRMFSFLRFVLSVTGRASSGRASRSLPTNGMACWHSSRGLEKRWSRSMPSVRYSKRLVRRDS